MDSDKEIFCIDTNVLIQAWQKYYSPDFCSDYWDIFNRLGHDGRIFIPEAVHDEINKTEATLSIWLKNINIPVKRIDESVSKNLQKIYAKAEAHKYLVDNTKMRSIADPWVIVHAMNEQATVVTIEGKVTAASRRIKIPNVCEKMGVYNLPVSVIAGI